MGKGKERVVQPRDRCTIKTKSTDTKVCTQSGQKEWSKKCIHNLVSLSLGHSGLLRRIKDGRQVWRAAEYLKRLGWTRKWEEVEVKRPKWTP